jgi:hypothetical protein
VKRLTGFECERFRDAAVLNLARRHSMSTEGKQS